MIKIPQSYRKTDGQTDDLPWQYRTLRAPCSKNRHWMLIIIVIIIRIVVVVVAIVKLWDGCCCCCYCWYYYIQSCLSCHFSEVTQCQAATVRKNRLGCCIRNFYSLDTQPTAPKHWMNSPTHREILSDFDAMQIIYLLAYLLTWVNAIYGITAETDTVISLNFVVVIKKTVKRYRASAAEIATTTPKHSVTAVRDGIWRRMPWQLDHWKTLKQNGCNVLCWARHWKHTHRDNTVCTETYNHFNVNFLGQPSLADNFRGHCGNLYRSLERFSFPDTQTTASKGGRVLLCLNIACKYLNPSAKVHSAEKYQRTHLQIVTFPIKPRK